VKYFVSLILVVLFAALALSEDFKTTNGKVYKNATVSRIEGDGIVLRTETGIAKVYFTELPLDVQERFHWAKPKTPREPFYGRWAVAAEDPAVLAKMIAAGAVIIASVALVINHIRSRRQPTTRVTRVSRRKAVDRARS
jgi:RsiW-degrading membrane proteinase PrsW (M82 family)